MHGLLEGLEVPLEEINLSSQTSTRGKRLSAMTGLTHMKLRSRHADTPASNAAPSQHAALELQLLLSKRVVCMPLLKSLEITGVPLGVVASAAALLHLTCPVLTDLRLVNISEGREWGYLWSALAAARSLRRLHIENFVVQSGSDFDGIRVMDQLHSLFLRVYVEWNDEVDNFAHVHDDSRDIPLHLSHLTGLTEVRVLKCNGAAHLQLQLLIGGGRSLCVKL